MMMAVVLVRALCSSILPKCLPWRGMMIVMMIQSFLLLLLILWTVVESGESLGTRERIVVREWCEAIGRDRLEKSDDSRWLESPKDPREWPEWEASRHCYCCYYHWLVVVIALAIVACVYPVECCPSILAVLVRLLVCGLVNDPEWETGLSLWK